MKASSKTAAALILVLASGSPLTHGHRTVSEVARQVQVARTSPEPPNVLILVTDDQRLGGMDVMPNTRQIFADGGIRFTEAFVTTPLCCPSRASIFTGRFVHNHKVLDTESAESLDQRTTLQHYLQTAGYFTSTVGKYLNLWNIRRDPPFFDRWAIFNDDYGEDGYRNERWNVDGRVQTLKRYTTSVITDKALEFLNGFEAEDERPWLLYVFPFAPHSPYSPHKSYAQARVPPWKPSRATEETNLADKPPWVKRNQVDLVEARRVRRGQLRTLMSVDDLMGRLFDHLSSLDEGRNTLMFYLSDNGLTWGEHGLISKRNPYTPSVKVPFFVRWLGADLSTIDAAQPVANLDIAPTVLEAAGVAADAMAPMDGISLIGPNNRNRMHLEYFREAGMPSWASTVTRNLQYTEYYLADGETVSFRELYRLDRDPSQLRNVLNDGNAANDPSAKALRDLSSQLASDRACIGHSCP